MKKKEDIQAAPLYFVLYFGVVTVYIRQHNKPLRKGLEALLACENASARLLALHSCMHETSARKISLRQHNISASTIDRRVAVNTARER